MIGANRKARFPKYPSCCPIGSKLCAPAEDNGEEEGGEEDGHHDAAQDQQRVVRGRHQGRRRTVHLQAGFLIGWRKVKQAFSMAGVKSSRLSHLLA